MHGRMIVSLFVVAGLAVTGCGLGGSPAPSLAPRDEIVAALDSTAELRTVHALVRVEIGGLAAETTTVTMEGDVDIKGRELDVTAAFEPEFFGSSEVRLVVADGFVFNRQGDVSWSISGDGVQDPLAMVPTTAAIAAAVEVALRDPETTIRFEGTEDCGDATCDRIRAEIPAAVAWRAVTTMIEPLGPPDASPPPMPESFPGFAIDVWIEQGTHRLRQATNTTSVDETTITIVVALSDHDAPITISPPVAPPAR
ncbi:MAG: hypothetical protein L0227_11080 [Chloroflexi bacterium]|nr:hypothetical protein [Chloroflexota bacterium]